MLKQQLQQKLQQKLSPQQIQVIRLLELTAIELEERIKQELIDNPALDEGQKSMKTPIPTNSETKIPMHLPKVLKTFPWEIT